jgi:hypothetical protein
MLRISISALVLIPLALAACASHQPQGPTHSAGAATAAAPGTLRTMSDGRRDVLRIAVPAGADCDVYQGHIFVGTRAGKVNIWLVPDAATLDEAARMVPRKIDSEFKEFKTTSTTTLIIPGEKTPATRLLGSGVEADDYDPGTADVIVFGRAGRIFIACTHGENLHDSAQQLMLRLVQSSTAP